MTADDDGAEAVPRRDGGGHDPLRAGLFRSLRRRDYTIDADRWRAASDAGDLIGECRRRGCGGYLVADDPPVAPGVPASFTARCLVCDGEVVAPNGRVLHRSGRHGEAPDFYGQRADLLKKRA
jgi:hypothetical protein